MKFIHTSDWHIGRQFHNVSLIDDQKYVLDQIIHYIKLEAVDALVISGDIYDRSVPPAVAVELLDNVLNIICTEMSVPVILIPGNHDSAERLGFGSRQLTEAGLHILSDLKQISRPVKVENAEECLSFYGIPYNDPEHVNDCYSTELKNHDEALSVLINEIKPVINKTEMNILLSHCFVDGAEESDSERPLSIGGADRVSIEHFNAFDYVALGHLHGPQYKGKESIRYSGSILKYSFSEQNHKKSVTLVETENNKLKSCSQLILKPIRNMRVIEGDIEQIIEQAKTDPHAEDYIMVRLTDHHAILNAMGKLREVYPNVLHLEKPGVLSNESGESLQRDKLKLSEFDMFTDFFKQITEHELTDEQNRALKDVINGLHKTQVDI